MGSKTWLLDHSCVASDKCKLTNPGIPSPELLVLGISLLEINKFHASYQKLQISFTVTLFKIYDNMGDLRHKILIITRLSPFKLKFIFHLI